MDDLISRSAVIDVLKETGIIQDNVGKPFNANYCPQCGAKMIKAGGVNE